MPLRQERYYEEEGPGIMSATQATADVFCAKFRSLPRKQQGAVVERLLQDRRFREDLMDSVILARREQEPARPLKEYLRDRRRKRR